MTDTPITFSVTYRRSEYLAFVREHTHAQLPPNSSSGSRALASFLINCFGSVAFLLKARRVGTCHFLLDESGVRRSSRSGEKILAWSDIKRVHAYSPGYLIELQAGSMPVPYRVLSDEQMAQVSSLFSSHACASAAT